MEEEILSIIAEESGERIDALLARTLEGLSRSAAQRLLEEGRVTREEGGKALRKSDRVQAGEHITVVLPELDGTLVNALLWHCGDSLSGIGGEKRPGIVHRIDKDTSGLLIVAKNDFAHHALSAQLQDRSLSRVYEAVVRGRLRADSGTIDRPIGRHPTDRKRMAVNEKNGRPAVTHWNVLARYAAYTHVRCRLETGRTHQIRVHMASIGHPLLGDGVYGAPCPEKGLEGQCLHARELKFIHPRTGEAVHLATGLPAWFTEVLSRLGPEE